MPEWKPEIRRRLANLRLEPTREAAIVEELAQYLEDCYAELLAGGVTPAEAERQTRAELSGSELLQRELRRMERQAAPEPIVLGNNRRKNMIADLWQDLRYGARMLWKKPGFTAVAVFTLALGIGANTAIFSMINSVLIESLPYPDSKQLVQIFEATPTFPRNSVSGGAFKDWREHGSKFAHLAIYEDVELNLTGTGAPERVTGLQVSSEFLSVLGVTPILGRGFGAGEDAVGGNNRVMVLAHRFWQSHYGGDASVIGKTVSPSPSMDAPSTAVGLDGAGFRDRM